MPTITVQDLTDIQKHGEKRGAILPDLTVAWRLPGPRGLFFQADSTRVTGAGTALLTQLRPARLAAYSS